MVQLNPADGLGQDSVKRGHRPLLPGDLLDDDGPVVAPDDSRRIRGVSDSRDRGGPDQLTSPGQSSFDAGRESADLAFRLAAATDAEVDEAITDSLAALAGAVRADRAYVTRYWPDGTLENSHEWTGLGVVPQLPAIQRIPTARFAWSHGQAVRGEVLSVATLDEFPPEAEPERASFGSFGVQSVLQVPIGVHGELLGVIGFNRFVGPSPEAWDHTMFGRVALVGRAIGLALQRIEGNERVRRALLSAELASRAKDDLIARASHELRTPLHAVVGFAEILELDGVRHDALTQIRENGRLLITMIDDLLELGRLAAVDLDLVAMVPVDALVADVLANLDSVAAARGVTLTITSATGDRPTALGTTRLRQTLHCVASASLAAAGPGGDVEARAVGVGASVQITFAYGGPAKGAPVGLGLALAQSFVEELRGTIEVAEEDQRVAIVVTLGPSATEARS